MKFLLIPAMVLALMGSAQAASLGSSVGTVREILQEYRAGQATQTQVVHTDGGAMNPLELSAAIERQTIPPSDLAPDFTLPGLHGVPVSLSLFRGKVVLLDFWASWCGPCRQSTPTMALLAHLYKDADFTVLGINLNDTPAKIQQFKSQMENSMGEADFKASVATFLKLPEFAVDLKLDYPTAIDDGTVFKRKYGGKGIPFFVLIGKDGKIIRRYSGYHGGRFQEFTEQIDAALAKQRS